MADIKKGWFCDHAPGRGQIVLATLQGVGATSLYFEMRIVQSTSGSKVCIGLANAGFNISNPVSLDLAAGAYAGLNGGCFLSFGTPTNNINGWSGGTTPPGGSGSASLTFANLDWIGVAVDTVNHLAWWRNASTPGLGWVGGASGSTADPSTGTNGYAYNSLAAMSGKVYILAGGGNENVSSPVPEGSINTGQFNFRATAPAGFSPWQTSGTILNSADAATQMVLFDAGNESFTQTAISGVNQPTAFARSVLGY